MDDNKITYNFITDFNNFYKYIVEIAQTRNTEYSKLLNDIIIFIKNAFILNIPNISVLYEIMTSQKQIPYLILNK